MNQTAVRDATRRLALALDQLSVYSDRRNLTSPAAGEPPITLGMLREVVRAVFDGADGEDAPGTIRYRRHGGQWTAMRATGGAGVVGVGETHDAARADLVRGERMLATRE